MPQKMTKMVLNTVDLKCSCCYKKVKKVLCKFPEIRDQVYDEKNNKVTIKILCCSPENIRDKLCCKGRKVIISIEIVDDTPPKETKETEKTKKEPLKETKETEKTKEEPLKETKETEKTKKKPLSETEKTKEEPLKETEKTKEAEKQKSKPEEYVLWTCTEEYVLWAPQAPAQPLAGNTCGPPMPMYPNGTCCGPCSQGYGGGPCYHGYGRTEKPKAPVKPKAQAPEAPAPLLPGNTCGPGQDYPLMPMYPNGTCCGPCSQGYGGGPCYHGYGRPVPPPPRPCYDYGYGYRRSKCCVSTDYFSDENPQGCTIM